MNSSADRMLLKKDLLSSLYAISIQTISGDDDVDASLSLLKKREDLISKITEINDEIDRGGRGLVDVPDELQEEVFALIKKNANIHDKIVERISELKSSFGKHILHLESLINNAGLSTDRTGDGIDRSV